MLDPGDKVLVEAPTFLGALQSFKLMQAEIVPVSCDAGGLVVEELEEKVKRLKPKMLYTIPTFQNPGGMTLTLERRKKVAELAARYGFVVIEDDPYCDLRYEGERLPAIKSFDEAGMVVTLMSFSKIISPGLRVGAAVASDEIMKRFVVAKQSADTHTSVLSQAIVDEYVKSGALPQHISRICEDYATRMRAMLDMMKSGFPASCKYNVPQGGLFIWAELPEGVDTLELLKKSIEKNVAFIPGTHFYDGGGHLNTLRLNFSASGIEDIKKGMGILSEIMRETYL
jgi:2-aminoadipate transaminase